MHLGDENTAENGRSKCANHLPQPFGFHEENRGDEPRARTGGGGRHTDPDATLLASKVRIKVKGIKSCGGRHTDPDQNQSILLASEDQNQSILLAPNVRTLKGIKVKDIQRLRRPAHGP